MSTIRQRRVWIAIACIAGAVAVAVWLKQKRFTEAVPSLTKQTLSAPPKTETKPVLALPKAERVDGKYGKWSVTDAWRQRIQDALATKDSLKWGPVIGELINPMFNRAEAIAELSALLDYPDWEVKTRAAQLLLILGSHDGVRVLQLALSSVAKGEAVSWTAAITAASVLHQYRQPIDPHDLYATYQHFKSPDLLTIATMQQIPEIRELVRQKRAKNELGYNTEWMAAYLEMNDPDSIAQYNHLLAGRPEAKLLGHWALYRTTGGSEHLDYVISTAEEAVGLIPPTSQKSQLMDIKYQALDYLQATVEPEATKALEKIADHAAAKPEGGMTDFTRAFGALFYVHQDYKYVDQRVLAFLQGANTGSSIDRSLMIQIAVFRGTHEMQAAAKAFNPSAYERALVEVQGRPVENWWPNLNHVPISIAPPLAK